jgi:prefoldin subunit 5
MSVTATEETAAALQRYSAFVDEVLKPQLQQTLARRDAIAREAAEYTELRALLAELQTCAEQQQPFKTLVYLSEGFRVRAKVQGTRMVTVDVGLHFHVEMTVPEASAFVTRHLQHLHECVRWLLTGGWWTMNPRIWTPS